MNLFDINSTRQNINHLPFYSQCMFAQQDIFDTSAGHYIGKELLFRAFDSNGKPLLVQMNDLNREYSLPFDRFVSASALMYSQKQGMTINGVRQIHLNINHTSLLDLGVINNLLALHNCLTAHGMQLVIELVEYTQPTKETMNQARRLQECGIKVAIDDLGRGYNTEEYLYGIAKPDYIKLVYDNNLLTLLDSVELAFAKFGAALNNIIVEYIDSEQKSKTMDAVGLIFQQGFLFRN